jgi:hypothetical protein
LLTLGLGKSGRSSHLETKTEPAEIKLEYNLFGRPRVERAASDDLLNTDSDLMANMYIVLNCRRKLLEHAYGYYRMELKLAFSSL